MKLSREPHMEKKGKLVSVHWEAQFSGKLLEDRERETESLALLK